jgi:antitoxin ParD1/3/4
MAKALNVSLTEPLREFVDRRTGEGALFATPSEYLRALIRQDMEQMDVVDHVLAGLRDIEEGRLSKKSILDLDDDTQ